MPSQLEPALEERFAEVLDHLRATHAAPSAELRQRVRGIAAAEPSPRQPLFRRRALVLALAAAVLIAAVVVGVVQRGGQEETISFSDPNRVAGGGQAESGASTVAQDTARAAPLSARIQDFRAQLTVRVDEPDDLPGATRQAMRLAEQLGGYVVSAQYGGGDSDSVMVLRVPVARAQEAIDRLTGLGEIAGQHFSLQDLQSTIDQLDAQGDRLEERIAELQQQLRNRKLTPAERVTLRNRLQQAQQQLQDLLAQRDATIAQGRFAEITLTLTAERKAAATSEGVLGRAVDALKRVWEWVLAILIVGLPFAVLLAGAFLVGRRLRRRSDERLLGG